MLCDSPVLAHVSAPSSSSSSSAAAPQQEEPLAKKQAELDTMQARLCAEAQEVERKHAELKRAQEEAAQQKSREEELSKAQQALEKEKDDLLLCVSFFVL